MVSIHTEYTVTAHTYTSGVAYERTFLNKEDAENYVKEMKKEPNISKCVIDTMLASDWKDRYQLKPLERRSE